MIMKGKIIWKVFAFIIISTLAVFLIGYIVMSLWNNILSPVLNVKTVDLKQAIGIFILAKILTGGVFRSWGGRGGYWKEKINRKLESMPEEERNYYQKMYWKKCGFDKKSKNEIYKEESEVDVKQFN